MKFIRYWRNKTYWIGMKRLRTKHGRLTCGLILTFIFFASYTLLENSDSRMKDYYRKKNILPIVRLSDYDTEDAQEAKRLYPRQILLWTPLRKDEEDRSSRALCLKSKQLQNCPYKCDITTDRSYFEISDAVVFDGSNLQFKKKSIWEAIRSGLYEEHEDIPEFRMNCQFWIFRMMETPVHTWINLKPFEGLFNWTMTYRRDSDVYTPYGRLSLHSMKLENADITKTLVYQNITHATDQGRKLAAWMTSDCQHKPFGMKDYVEELQKYIPIDVFVKCGVRNCTSFQGSCEDSFSCYKTIGPKYKFYLAFESALCVDYITEQFYNALRVEMVPVVFGHGDYSKVTPRSSYIDARSFESAKKLAEYLLFLDTHPEEYVKYLEWKKSYHVHEVNYFEDAWCSLCEKLWKTPQNSTYQLSSSARDLENWWYHASESPFESACSHSS